MPVSCPEEAVSAGGSIVVSVPTRLANPGTTDPAKGGECTIGPCTSGGRPVNTARGSLGLPAGLFAVCGFIWFNLSSYGLVIVLSFTCTAEP